MTTYMVRLDGIRSEDISMVGGKAAPLGKLIYAGVSVPPGLCVTTKGYEQHLGQERIVKLISEITRHERCAALFEKRLEEVGQLIEQTPMPHDVEMSIIEAYSELFSPEEDGQAVAVRSSGTMEDLPYASFAGQFRTYLNVREFGNILSCVKSCWASIWTRKVAQYCSANQLAFWDLQMAVLVQQMIHPCVAGLMFTANPVTGREKEIIIESCWGLGEGVVKGEVLTDTYVLEVLSNDQASASLVNKSIMEKDLMYLLEHETGGVVPGPVPSDQRLMPSLSDQEAVRLAEIGLQVTEICGSPQDIEWAFQDGEFYILQSRPITGLRG